MMRVIGYVRVSTDKQADAGASLDAQAAKLRAYALATDLEIVKIEVDAGASAKTLERPAIQRAIAALRAGEAAGLLVAKLDRLTRSVKDLGHLIEDVFHERSGLSLLSVHDSLDPRTAAGRLVLNVLTSVAQWEREATAERTREVLAHLQAEGVHLGAVPVGIRRGEQLDAHGRRVLLADVEGALVIDRILRLSNAGHGVRAIAQRLTADGVRTPRGGTTWQPTVVFRILKRARAAEASPRS